MAGCGCCGCRGAVEIWLTKNFMEHKKRIKSNGMDDFAHVVPIRIGICLSISKNFYMLVREDTGIVLVFTKISHKKFLKNIFEGVVKLKPSKLLDWNCSHYHRLLNGGLGVFLDGGSYLH